MVEPFQEEMNETLYLFCKSVQGAGSSMQSVPALLLHLSKQF